MTSTFLHEDKKVPPDELLEDGRSLHCEKCGQVLFLTRQTSIIGDARMSVRRDFECKNCGLRTSVG
jgi:DNA-directed RNA polymerase subunit RPC12/RpoP